MKRLTDDYLLSEMRRKINELGRAPLKEEIDSDSSMPHSYTYFERFGGINKALKILGETPTRHSDLTLDSFLEFVKQFYEEEGKAPTSKDFDANPKYPHSSFVRELNISWVKVLKLAKLKPYTRGETWIKNRQAELKIKEILINAKRDVMDLKEEGTKNGSFVIDGKLIKVRSSNIYKTVYKGNVLTSWKFKLHHNLVVIADYYICVGMNEGDIQDIYVIPLVDIDVKECISIPIDSSRISKYDAYKVNEEELIRFNFQGGHHGIN